MCCPQVILGRPKHHVAGWSSPVAREAHNLEVAGSNPVPATFFTPAGPSWPLRACFFGGLLPPWRQPCCGGRAILAPAGLFFRRPPAAVASTVLRGQGHPGPCGLGFSAASCRLILQRPQPSWRKSYCNGTFAAASTNDYRSQASTIPVLSANWFAGKPSSCPCVSHRFANGVPSGMLMCNPV